MNKVILLGNVGQDPEIINFENGTKMARFSLATSTRWTDKEGQKKERTEWHQIIVGIPKMIEVCEKHVKKGTKLAIEGEIRNNNYEKDDVKHFSYHINASYFEFCGSAAAKPPVTADMAEVVKSETHGPENTSSGDDDLPF